jgi:hypothetical protein
VNIPSIWNLDGFMQKYEIRIRGKSTDAVTEVTHLSDHAAMRAARKIGERPK